jgi:2-polyprenyl-6-hydroxyphenyl methylase/3-demethylubiquinone-9 3-methyltransferase
MNSESITAAGSARFEFGKNWARFLTLVDEERVRLAEASVRSLLEVETLEGKSFLDVGSGSGLFSLAARRLGARVHSFDYDRDSVACTAELKRRYFPGDPLWTVERGSALDSAYMEALGTFDVVYSWGVLHHTGDMWTALDLVHRRVAPDGRLAIAIYNHAGGRTRRWGWIKRLYVSLPRPLRPILAAVVMVPGEVRAMAGAVLNGRPSEYVRSWTRYGDTKRGMSRWRDHIDWVGGYPYEAARADQIFSFYRDRGYDMTQLVCSSGLLGCNEFVFRRSAADASVRNHTGQPARTP